MPVKIPKRYDITRLADAEVLLLFTMVSVVTVGCGTGVDGWPRWAQCVARGVGPFPGRVELSHHLFARALFTSYDVAKQLPTEQVRMPDVTADGALQFDRGEPVAVEDLLDGVHLRKDEWLRQSQ